MMNEINENRSIISELTNAVEQLKQQQSQPVKDFDKVRPQILNIYTLVKQVASDFQTLRVYRDNMIFKQYVLNVMADLILSTHNFEFKKKCCFLVKRLIDRDYDESTYSFYDPQVVPVYGNILAKIINSLTDIAIEQSFFSNIEDPKKNDKDGQNDAYDDDYDDDHSDEENRPSSASGLNTEQRDQNRLLTLLKYILKTVNLKTLVKCGFNRVHVQFLIINFSLSRLTPKLIEALTGNQLAESNLYTHEDADESEEKKQVTIKEIDNVLIITFKSCNLLFKLNINDAKTIQVLFRVHENLSNYVKYLIKNRSLCEMINVNVWRRYCSKKVKFYGGRLFEESNVKYRRFNYRNILYFIKIILFHYGNMNRTQKTSTVDKLMTSVKRILCRLQLGELNRELDNDEVTTRHDCFLLVAKFITIFKEKFIDSHLKNFQHIWLNEVKNHNEMAFSCILNLLKIKTKKTQNFAQNLRNYLPVCFYSEPNVKNTIIAYAQVTRELIRYNAVNFPNQTFDQEENFLQFVEKIRIVLKTTLKCSPTFTNEFIEFNRHIFDFILAKNGRTVSNVDVQIMDIFICFQLIMTYSLNFEVPDQTLFNCLALINSIGKVVNNKEEFVQNHGISIREMINFIEMNVAGLETKSTQLAINRLNKLIKNLSLTG